MPGYLTASGIETCIQYIASSYPAIAQAVVMPETSIEGRTIRALKIASGGGTDRHGVLFLGGVHARELINPDMLVAFGLHLCQAYTNNTGLTFGGKAYSAGTIQMIVNALVIFMLPLVNPDGRAYCQSPAGYAMWRKNRNLNPGMACQGVDLNRNFDFLWSSGIGTSSNSCSDVFKGSAAFSEPETRNVRHLLNAYNNIRCMVDIHSYSQLILYPWGDDNNQTTDASMNFQNPIYDGLRGIPGDSNYKEYIPAADLDWFSATGNRVRSAIMAVRGRSYTLEQSIGLYPTTGTSDDYAYSRHYVDASKRKVYGFTVETALEFQPLYAEALNVMDEVTAGLIEYCLACICVAESTMTAKGLHTELSDIRRFRDHVLMQNAAGKRYIHLLEKHSAEVAEILANDIKLQDSMVDTFRKVVEVTVSSPGKPKVFNEKLIGAMEQALAAVSKQASNSLKQSIEEVSGDLRHFKDRDALKGLEEISRTKNYCDDI